MISRDRNVLFAARTLMALIFLVAGTRKLLAWGATVGYFNKLGIPLPEIALGLTVALEIVGGIALVLGWRVQAVAVVMGAFTLISAVIAHAFWAAAPPQFNAQLLNFLKNTAIVGGFLLLAYVGGNQKAFGLREGDSH